MRNRLTRRALLGGGIAALGSAALAEAPLTALRPQARTAEAQIGDPPGRPGKRLVARPSSETLVVEAALGGNVAFLLADARTGEVLDSREPDVPLPPASVSKAVTALYALNALEPQHRYVTRLLATGPVTEGVLDGDLILAGGGDPVLTTDHMADLAARLKAAGLREVRGAFRVWGGALPYVNEIEPGQLDHLSYNPALSGLNLNFNRVHFEWTRSGGDFQVSMDARSDLYRPAVSVARMRIADRELPVYSYASAEGSDNWTVARGALGNGGSRWLPVRHPALYAGDVFRTFARSQGIVLPAPVEAAAPPEGAALAELPSAPLDEILGDMLLYSTNLTAEIVGLTASRARGADPQTLAASAALMRTWVGETFGAEGLFSDHSGLADTSRISVRDMVRILSGAGQSGRLRGLLKPIPMTDAAGDRLAAPPATVMAKTGTLNFVSTLAGYVTGAEGREMVFAIFTGDLQARGQAKENDDEVPPGSRDWNSRSKRLQQQLLQRWGRLYPA